MYDRFGLFIAGQWAPAMDGNTAPLLSPVSERALGGAPVAGIADTDAAIAAATSGYNVWKAMAAAEAPFGGTNHSGMGREGGAEAILDDLDVKSSQMVWA
jgi:acyl-CoA reductase-like NAD-dependent aldehyde dehydrogenase